MTGTEATQAGMCAEKARLRLSMLAARRLPAPAWAAAASRRVQDHVLALREWAAARRVAVYIALRGETGTERLARDCRAHGRAMAVPALRAQGNYGFVWWHEGDALERGPLGTREPAVRRWLAPGELDVVIVPGLAFDAGGRRLGHGGGHYDRLLAAGGDDAGALKIGIGFGFQLVERVPADERDARMDWVITEEDVICCSRKAAQERGTQ